MNRIYLVRHGENPANLTGEFSCRNVDYSLTAKGVLQARQTAEYFLNKQIDAIYSSPLRRARETAAIIGNVLGLRVVELRELTEVDVGELEGHTMAESISKLWPAACRDWFDGKLETRLPGGESGFELAARLRAAVRQMVEGHDGKNIVAVGHGGLFTLALRAVCPDADLDLLRYAPNHNCSVSLVEIEPACGTLRGKLVQWAFFGHLHGEAGNLVPGIPPAGMRPHSP